MSKLVLLDLDRTILACNSAQWWIKREWKLGYITTWQLLKTLGWLTLYHWGKADVQTFLREGGMWMAGTTESDIQQRTKDLWLESIAQQVRPEVYAMLDWHREQGHVLALLTASSNYLADLVATQLNIPHVLSNRMESSEGVLTGKMLEPLCFGAEKSVHAELLSKQLNLDWRQGYFYTDSYSDLPVLEAVQYPKVVCPDQRLEREAQKRGWDILWWSEPEVV